MFMRILPAERDGTAPKPASRRSSKEKTSSKMSAFKSQGAEDPFLTGPNPSAEQLNVDTQNPGSMPTGGDDMYRPVGPTQEMGESASISPSALQASGMSRDPSDQPSMVSHQNWLSPTTGTENGYSDLSSYASPEFDNPFFLPHDMGFGDNSFPDLPPDDANQLLEYHRQHTPQENRTADPAQLTQQLLSPVLTGTPSPKSAAPNFHPTTQSRGTGNAQSPTSVSDVRQARGRKSPQPPSQLKTTTGNDSLNVQGADHADHADQPPSPVVKISRYTRGDSPSGEDGGEGRAPGKRGRSDHLAPDHDDSDTDTVSNSSRHRRTISVPVSSLRGTGGAWIPDDSTGQAGLSPGARGDTYIPSPKEMAVRQQLEEKNAEVQHWLAYSEANSDAEGKPSRHFKSRMARKLSVGSRRRSKSIGDPSVIEEDDLDPTPHFDDSTIPGPGALLEEDSDEGEDGDDDEESTASESTARSPPAQVDLNVEDDDLSLHGTSDEPLPRQFIRANPWRDPARNSGICDTQDQPGTSNAAIMRFMRRAQNVETASLAATLGTRDMSEADVESIIGPDGHFSNLQIDKEKKKSRRGSFLEHATKFLPKRSNSNAKRKGAESADQQKQQQQQQQQQQHQHQQQHHEQNEHQRPSVDSLRKWKSHDTPERSSSPSLLGRSISRSSKAHRPSNAVLSMTEQITSIGVGKNNNTSTSAASPVSNHSRSRSKSNQGHGSLMELVNSFGGPPVPTLASPHVDKPATYTPTNEQPFPADEDDDDLMDDKGVVMDFPIGAELIIPDVEGFKTHVQELNPRLEPALVERIAHEQYRRYKRLVDLKTKHAQAVSQGRCSSGAYCFDQGGVAEYLQPRASPKDPDSTYGQFQVNGQESADGALESFSDGTVVAALFPPGVPMPPVKRLPAKFECTLCFKEKSFQKPSDWTKHVHEDLQPFTCTFPDCTEPKSFKRKADWVRHESERHRHPEWWTCNVPDCTHTCYRKDNFVQHLVREHNMANPGRKTRKPRSNRNSDAGLDYAEGQHIGSEGGLDELWRRVDECHHFTNKQPREEPCRFCGNICNSWKKLTVHTAKHMEQIAMPVLDLVRQLQIPGEEDAHIPFSFSQQHQQQPQQSSSHLPTPVSGYNTSKSGQHMPSPASSRVSSKSVSQAASVYGTSGLLSEAFGVTSTPLSPRKLQMQNALNNAPSRHGGSHPSGTTPNYAVNANPHYTSSPLGGDQMYQNPTQHEPKGFVNRVNSATYPPVNQSMRDSSMAEAPATALPYTLDMNAVAQNNAFQSQNMYASPGEGMGYMYQTGQQNVGDQFSMSFPPSNDMGYPDGSMAQGNGYVQNGGGQY